MEYGAPVTLDAALNLVWAAIGFSGLAALAVADLGSSRTLPRRLRRFAAVLLFAALLFPCVSLTDDFFLSSLLQADLVHHGGFGSTIPEESSGDHAANIGLARLLGSLNHIRISAIYALAIAMAFFGVVFLRHYQLAGRIAFCRNGRDPPAL